MSNFGPAHIFASCVASAKQITAPSLEGAFAWRPLVWLGFLRWCVACPKMGTTQKHTPKQFKNPLACPA